MMNFRNMTLAAVVAFGAAFAGTAPAMAHDRLVGGMAYGYQSYAAPAYAQSHRMTRHMFDRHFVRNHRFERAHHSDRGRIDMRGNGFRGLDRGRY